MTPENVEGIKVDEIKVETGPETESELVKSESDLVKSGFKDKETNQTDANTISIEYD